jgi:hypothetical protein
VVIAMAVTRDGIPVRCWTFPGDTPDQKIIRKVKDDLAGWNLRRLVRVAGRGFASQANRACLAKGGGHYLHAEKLRDTNREAAAALARQDRYRAVAGNLRVKEVWVPARDAGARAERFVVCRNPEQALRDQLVRGRLVAHQVCQPSLGDHPRGVPLSTAPVTDTVYHKPMSSAWPVAWPGAVSPIQRYSGQLL